MPRYFIWPVILFVFFVGRGWADFSIESLLGVKERNERNRNAAVLIGKLSVAAFDMVNSFNNGCKFSKGNPGKRLLARQLRDKLLDYQAIHNGNGGLFAASKKDFEQYINGNALMSVSSYESYLLYEKYKKQLVDFLVDDYVVFYPVSKREAKKRIVSALNVIVSSHLYADVPRISLSDSSKALRSYILDAKHDSFVDLQDYKKAIYSELVVFGNSMDILGVAVGNPKLLGALIDYGFDPDQKGFSGKTPLMIAAEKNEYASVKLLLERKANPDIYTSGSDACRDAGWSNVTALHLAVRNASFDVIKMLLSFGASIDVVAVGDGFGAEGMPVDWLHRYASKFSDKNKKLTKDNVEELAALLDPGSDGVKELSLRYVLEAEKVYANEDYLSAIALLNKAILVDGGNIRALNDLAIANYKQGKYSESVKNSSEVLLSKAATNKQKAAASHNLYLACSVEIAKHRKKHDSVYGYPVQKGVNGEENFCSLSPLSYLVDAYSYDASAGRAESILNFFKNSNSPMHLCLMGGDNDSKYIYKDKSDIYFISQDMPPESLEISHYMKSVSDDDFNELESLVQVGRKQYKANSGEFWLARYKSAFARLDVSVFMYAGEMCSPVLYYGLDSADRILVIDSSGNKSVTINVSLSESYLLLLYGYADWVVKTNNKVAQKVVAVKGRVLAKPESYRVAESVVGYLGGGDQYARHRHAIKLFGVKPDYFFMVSDADVRLSDDDMMKEKMIWFNKSLKGKSRNLNFSPQKGDYMVVLESKELQGLNFNVVPGVNITRVFSPVVDPEIFVNGDLVGAVFIKDVAEFKGALPFEIYREENNDFYFGAGEYRLH